MKAKRKSSKENKKNSIRAERKFKENFKYKGY